MMVYLLLYNFLCFMFMLNFIIAIICESYLAVTAIVKNSEADQEFFTDIYSVIMVFFVFSHVEGRIRLSCIGQESFRYVA